MLQVNKPRKRGNNRVDYKKLRVLIVDDYMIIRKLVAQQLVMLGVAHVDAASDGVEAQEMLARNKYDIVLLDWGMPNKNGFDLLRECKADQRFSETAIIMMTGESEKKSVKDALEAGACSYLVKPVDLDSLKAKIDAAVQKLTESKVKADD